MTETRSLEEALQQQERTARILQHRRARLSSLYDSSRKTEGGWEVSESVAKEIRDLEGECKGLSGQLQNEQMEVMSLKNSSEMERLRSTPSAAAARLFAGDGGSETTSAGNGSTGIVKAYDTLGDAVIAQDSYKSWTRGRQQTLAVELPREMLKATLLSTGMTGYERVPGVVQYERQRLMVADLLAQATTKQPTIRYLRESSAPTNTAAGVLEEGLKPEMTWPLEEVDAPVRKIAVISRVSEEMWEDYDAIKGYINERTPFMVAERSENYILSGSGTAPQVRGILNTSGIQTYALTGTDTNADAIFRAMMKVRSIGFFAPDGVVIHPDNWTPIRLLKTTVGEYVWGHPSVVGPDTIFGERVVVTTAITANTALVGAFKLGAQIFYRQGMQVEATNTDGEDFRYNRIAIRAETRFALAVYRPLAFCTATSLTTV